MSYRWSQLRTVRPSIESGGSAVRLRLRLVSQHDYRTCRSFATCVGYCQLNQVESRPIYKVDRCFGVGWRLQKRRLQAARYHLQLILQIPRPAGVQHYRGIAIRQSERRDYGGGGAWCWTSTCPGRYRTANHAVDRLRSE